MRGKRKRARLGAFWRRTPIVATTLSDAHENIAVFFFLGLFRASLAMGDAKTPHKSLGTWRLGSWGESLGWRPLARSTSSYCKPKERVEQRKPNAKKQGAYDMTKATWLGYESSAREICKSTIMIDLHDRIFKWTRTRVLLVKVLWGRVFWRTANLSLR